MKLLLSIILCLAMYGHACAQSARELTRQAKELVDKGAYEKALPLLTKAAQRGFGEAQYRLGYLLMNGLGTAKDTAAAIRWYKRSSANNFNDGHYALAMAYGRGEGIEKDAALAFSYALKCARNNVPACMSNVASCYLAGNGVAKDEAAFKNCIVRLAKLENPEDLAQSGYVTSARLQLAKYYRQGLYFSKDRYQSYLWYIFFNESRKDHSVFVQLEAIEELRLIEKELSNEQLENSKQDAQKLLGRTLHNYAELHVKPR